MNINNIVGSGNLEQEFECDGLITHLKSKTEDTNQTVEADFGATSGVEFKYADNLPRATIHKQGSYIIRANNPDELRKANDAFLETISDMGIIDDSESIDFKVVNVVANHDLGIDGYIDLNKLHLSIYEGRTEYEPEQFPAVIYYDDVGYTVLIYNSGKIVISGAKSPEQLDDAVEFISGKLEI